MSAVKEVWVLRPPTTALQWPVQLLREEQTAKEILAIHHQAGIESTLTRETLLTPAQRDVLVSAAETRDFYRANVGENGHPFPLTDLFLRVDTLRAQEGA